MIRDNNMNHIKKRFEIKGRGINNNRKRRRFYLAFAELEAKEMAIADGIQIEEIINLPIEKYIATDAQKKYAQDLGVSFPSNISITEMSDLISCAKYYDKMSSVGR